MRPRQRRTRMQRPATLFGAKFRRWPNYGHEDMDLSVGADNMMRHVCSYLCAPCWRCVSLVRTSLTIRLFKTLTHTPSHTHRAVILCGSQHHVAASSAQSVLVKLSRPSSYRKYLLCSFHATALATVQIVATVYGPARASIFEEMAALLVGRCQRTSIDAI